MAQYFYMGVRISLPVVKTLLILFSEFRVFRVFAGIPFLSRPNQISRAIETAARSHTGSGEPCPQPPPEIPAISVRTDLDNSRYPRRRIYLPLRYATTLMRLGWCSRLRAPLSASRGRAWYCVIELDNTSPIRTVELKFCRLLSAPPLEQKAARRRQVLEREFDQGAGGCRSSPRNRYE